MSIRGILHLPARIPYVCSSCLRHLSQAVVRQQRRAITQNYLKKQAEANAEWAKRAQEIRAGNQDSMLAMLEKRGYINQIVG